ncbi:nuclease-related domain-containing DEAD/DEAH box helicase [Pseudoalteromonas sp. S16_S37]|uniref:nuclease-related domain-containing DEAD/DEAH box helicase n=1 Tax=Pseudoalteromonas sp. S16_S37 TaxID=2720228 RepID=UPI001681B57D|nr:NERD domain-containing protein [Pseudoalteromonas sp. S16_S37]MBD1583256.1 AAA family ATPase [Pseudoalteromonas sp. S16_S37]
MATIYPPFLPDNCPSSEKKVRTAFSQIENITIFHSLCWQSQRNNRQGDGEADFILLLPKIGVLILEVKGGSITLENGTWYTTDRFKAKHVIKDPFVQAKDSKYALLAYLNKENQSLTKVPIIHAVVFPDLVVTKSLSINSPRELIIDKYDLQNPYRALVKVAEHWKAVYHFPEHYLDKISSLLAPTMHVRKLPSDVIEETERGIINLTNEQIKTLISLKRAKQAIIYGTAGAGKTILAVEKARQLNMGSYKTLFLCYNKLLCEKIKITLEDTAVAVETFHSLAVKEARQAKIAIPKELDAQWYEEQALKLLIESISSNQSQFDAIIIDEAQDFSSDWIKVLQGMIATEGVFYIFADSHQNLYRRGWAPPLNLTPYDLLKNCRNTKQIATTVANIYKDELLDNGLYGPESEFIESNTYKDSLDLIFTTTERLLSKNVACEHIVVLTNSNLLVNQLRTHCINEYMFTSYGKLGICVETIRRFKGLECHTVIVAIDDSELDDHTIQALSYVGISRAKSKVYFIASKKVKAKLNWL